MFILSCRVCDCEFEAKTTRRMYCSQRCKDKGKPSAAGLVCFLCDKPMARGRDSKPQGEAAHNKCRSSFVGVRTHGEAGYSTHGCRCDICRAAKAKASRDYQAKVKARDGVSYTMRKRREAKGIDPNLSTSCALCGEPLVNLQRAGKSAPLHKACRNIAPKWLRLGEDRPTPKRDAFQRMIDKAAAGSDGGKRVFVAGPCRWCAEVVVGTGFYCSDKCKKSAAFKRRSSGASFQVSPRMRKELYERDSWTCQLCWHPVDGGLHYRDNWAASLDHIIPQSQQLIPDHSPSNLRLVHRMCNSMRGDGSNMTESEFHQRIEAHFGVSKIAA